MYKEIKCMNENESKPVKCFKKIMIIISDMI